MQLAKWLFIHKMSGRELSKILGVHFTSVNKWMSGSRVPTEEMMSKIRTITQGRVISLKDITDRRSKNDNQEDRQTNRTEETCPKEAEEV